MPQSLPRPDDPISRRRAALAGGEVGHVLVAAGGWLREQSEERRAEAMEALEAIAPSEAQATIAAIDVGVASEALHRALETAFEAGLEEDEEERAALDEAAVEALVVRDDVESSLVAAECIAARAETAAEAAQLREVASVLRAGLSAVDTAARRQARVLSALNPSRRARAAELAPPFREGAWWWTERAEETDDGLLAALAGLEAPVGADAAADAARAVLAPRSDALGAALRAAETGEADGAAMRWSSSESRRSEPVAIALRLVRELRVDALDSIDE